MTTVEDTSRGWREKVGCSFQGSASVPLTWTFPFLFSPPSLLLTYPQLSHDQFSPYRHHISQCCLATQLGPTLCNPMDCRPPPRLLCLWDFPGKNTGVGCHFLLQGTFLAQGSNPSFLHWQVGSLPLSHLRAWACSVVSDSL